MERRESAESADWGFTTPSESDLEAGRPPPDPAAEQPAVRSLETLDQAAGPCKLTPRSAEVCSRRGVLLEQLFEPPSREWLRRSGGSRSEAAERRQHWREKAARLLRQLRHDRHGLIADAQRLPVPRPVPSASPRCAEGPPPPPLLGGGGADPKQCTDPPPLRIAETLHNALATEERRRRRRDHIRAAAVVEERRLQQGSQSRAARADWQRLLREEHQERRRVEAQWRGDLHAVRVEAARGSKAVRDRHVEADADQREEARRTRVLGAALRRAQQLAEQREARKGRAAQQSQRREGMEEACRQHLRDRSAASRDEDGLRAERLRMQAQAAALERAARNDAAAERRMRAERLREQRVVRLLQALADQKDAAERSVEERKDAARFQRLLEAEREGRRKEIRAEAARLEESRREYNAQRQRRHEQVTEGLLEAREAERRRAMLRRELAQEDRLEQLQMVRRAQEWHMDARFGGARERDERLAKRFEALSEERQALRRRRQAETIVRFPKLAATKAPSPLTPLTNPSAVRSRVRLPPVMAAPRAAAA